MAIQYSTALKNGILVGNSLRALLSTGLGMRLYIYSGTVPENADAATAGGTLLVTITDNGSGDPLTLESTASGGYVSKPAAQVWSGVVAELGTATYFRLGVGNALEMSNVADPATGYRIQGTVGTVGADLILSSADLQVGNTQGIGVAQFGFPG